MYLEHLSRYLSINKTTYIKYTLLITYFIKLLLTIIQIYILSFYSANIKLLITLSSKVFLFYKINLNIWRSASVNDSIGIEAQSLKKFFDEYPVAGLIFTGPDIPDDSVSTDYIENNNKSLLNVYLLSNILINSEKY